MVAKGQEIRKLLGLRLDIRDRNPRASPSPQHRQDLVDAVHLCGTSPAMGIASDRGQRQTSRMAMNGSTDVISIVAETAIP
jgi:hypothetical protein